MFTPYSPAKPCYPYSVYIRRTKISSSSKGSHYSYRLVETRRVAGKVKQITLLNLGTHFKLDAEHWPTLCRCIEQMMSGQMPLLSQDAPEEVNKQASQIVQRLRTMRPVEDDKAWHEQVNLAAQQDEDVRPARYGRWGLSVWQCMRCRIADTGLSENYEAVHIFKGR